MRKKIIFCISILAILFFSLIANAATNRHLDELKSEFPHGILTDDYGVLSKNDLAINQCLATPTPITPKSHSYSYWQCFETKNIFLHCESGNIPDEHEGVMGLVVVKAVTANILHDYIERRLSPIKDCKGLVKDVKKILKRTQHACISGSFIGEEFTTIPEKKTKSWTFERIKTRKGCEGMDCDFTKKFKRAHCQDFKL